MAGFGEVIVFGSGLMISTRICYPYPKPPKLSITTTVYYFFLELTAISIASN